MGVCFISRVKFSNCCYVYVVSLIELVLDCNSLSILNKLLFSLDELLFIWNV